MDPVGLSRCAGRRLSPPAGRHAVDPGAENAERRFGAANRPLVVLLNFLLREVRYPGALGFAPMFRTRLAPLSLVLATLGCSVLRPSSIGPDRSDVVWREFRSEHFVVTSDADGSVVREAMADFEQTNRALLTVLFQEEGGAPEPIRIVLFAHDADLHRFVPSEASAAFLHGQPGDPARPSMVLVETSLSEEGKQTFTHELTHAFVERWFGPVPLWLNEGLAQYFESMRVEKGRIVLAEPAASAGFGFQATQMPGLTALITADRSVFYAGFSGHSVEGMYQRASFYVASWCLVRMLMLDQGDYHRRFFRYLDALTHRVPPQAAWARAFDAETYRRLQHDYAEYFRAELETAFVSVDISVPPDVVRRERVVPSDEMRSLWSRLGHVAHPPATGKRAK